MSRRTNRAGTNRAYSLGHFVSQQFVEQKDMRLENISVSKKIWLNLLLVMAILVGAAGVQTHFMTQVNRHVQEEVRNYDNNIILAVRWRADAEMALNQLVGSIMSAEESLQQALDLKYIEYTKASEELMHQLEQRSSHPEVKRQLDEIANARSAVLALIKKAVMHRDQGDSRRAQQVLDQELMPAAQAYITTQRDLVKLQERLRDANVAEGDAKIQNTILTGVLMAVIAIVVGLLVARIVIRQVTEPLDRAVVLANHIASGDLTRDIEDSRKDELGYLLRSLSIMTHKLRDAVDKVRGGVEALSCTAGQIADGNMDLSSRTEKTAANLQETAASIEELATTVTRSAETARQANQLAATAAEAAARGGAVVQQVVQSMERINTSSHKISDIIGVIDDIAFQTNILALNAAVEAARAGEQGRGFAVVAGEVRNLAQRSAEAAKEIKGLITASVSNVDAGADQVVQAGDSMQEIVASVRSVTDLIAAINVSTSEQRDSIAQVNLAVNNLDRMTQQNAALVEESSAATVAMHEQAQRLSSVVSMFNVGNVTGTSITAAVSTAASVKLPVLHRGTAVASPVSHPAPHSGSGAARKPPVARPATVSGTKLVTQKTSSTLASVSVAPVKTAIRTMAQHAAPEVRSAKSYSDTVSA